MENFIRNKKTTLSERSSKQEICRVFVIDEFGEETSLTFKILEYNNLMDLILNELWEEWGDCRGQAVCGTCQVEILSGSSRHEIESLEAKHSGFCPIKHPAAD